jgi:hypothetical protein
MIISAKMTLGSTRLAAKGRGTSHDPDGYLIIFTEETNDLPTCRDKSETKMSTKRCLVQGIRRNGIVP